MIRTLGKLIKKRKINPLLALGEVFLVFLGVSMSLAVDQWIGRRAESQREHQLLLEVVEGLKRDTLKIARIIDGSNQVLTDIDYSLEHLKTDTEFTKTLSYRMSCIGGHSRYYPSNAGFETLKSEGLSIIKNDSIRIALTRTILLKEITKDWSDLMQTQFMKIVQPLLIRDFKQWNVYESIEPIDFNQLKNNLEFTNSIQWWKLDHKIYSDHLTETKAQMKRSLKIISQYLDE